LYNKDPNYSGVRHPVLTGPPVAVQVIRTRKYKEWLAVFYTDITTDNRDLIP